MVSLLLLHIHSRPQAAHLPGSPRTWLAAHMADSSAYCCGAGCSERCAWDATSGVGQLHGGGQPAWASNLPPVLPLSPERTHEQLSYHHDYLCWMIHHGCAPIIHYSAGWSAPGEQSVRLLSRHWADNSKVL